jgi:hypothetical protein
MGRIVAASRREWPFAVSPQGGFVHPATPPFSKRRAMLVALPLCAALGSAWAADEPAAGWNIVGRQGIVALVLVPAAQAVDRQAYEREIDRLCRPDQTCFLNFYTNSKGLAVTVPLPDGIADEATATFRRSTKQGAQMFRWSCRMKVSTNECF